MVGLSIVEMSKPKVLAEKIKDQWTDPFWACPYCPGTTHTSVTQNTNT
jgi:hypothetical protein